MDMLTWVDLNNGWELSRDPVDWGSWRALLDEIPCASLDAVKQIDARPFAFFSSTGPGTNAAELAEFRKRAADAVVGLTWFEACLWCNLLSQSMGRGPAYWAADAPMVALDPVQVAKGKLTLPTVDAAADGVRLPSADEWARFVKRDLIKPVRGLKEWIDDVSRRDAPWERSVIDEDGSVPCNGYFRRSCVGFRALRRAK